MHETTTARLASSAEAAAAVSTASSSQSSTGVSVSWLYHGLSAAAAKQAHSTMSPLLAALLRQNPTQWAAAGDALAQTSRAAMAQQRRHFSLGKWMPSLRPIFSHSSAAASSSRGFLFNASPASAHYTAAFSKVWAEAGRFAMKGGEAAMAISSTTTTTAAAAVSRVAASAAANPVRVVSMSMSWVGVAANCLPRAPAALFLLSHHAQNAAVARRLPNLSGVAVLLLIGGEGGTGKEGAGEGRVGVVLWRPIPH